MTRSRRSHSIFDLCSRSRSRGWRRGPSRRPTPPPAPRPPSNPAFVAYQQRARTMGPNAAVEPLVPAPVDPRPWTKAVLPLGPLALGSSYDPSYDLGDPGIGKLPPVRDQLRLQHLLGLRQPGVARVVPPAHRPRGLQRGQPGGRRRHRFRHRRLQPRQLLHDHRRARALERSDRRGLRPLPRRWSFRIRRRADHARAERPLPARPHGVHGHRQRRHQVGDHELRRRLHADVRRRRHEHLERLRLLQRHDQRLLLQRPRRGRPRRRHRRLGRRLPRNELQLGRSAGGQRRLHRAQQLGRGLGRQRLLLRLLRRRPIGTSMAVFTSESIDDYAQNFGYDTLGFTDRYGYGSDTAWMAAGFTPKGDSQLEAGVVLHAGPRHDLRRLRGIEPRRPVDVVAGRLG